jgi:hypothetical protein
MIRLSAGRDRHDIRHTLVPAAASLASASFAPGNGRAPNRSTAAWNDRSKERFAAWARISSSGNRTCMTSAVDQPRVRSN